MNIDFELLLCAVGLAFVFEGLPWFLFPDFMRRAMTSLIESPNKQARGTGLIAITMGLLIIYLVRGN